MEQESCEDYVMGAARNLNLEKCGLDRLVLIERLRGRFILASTKHS